MTILQLICSNDANLYTGSLTDTDVAQLAAWASRSAKLCSHLLVDAEYKRAFSLIREGADLLLRQRILGEAKKLAWVTKDASMADVMQDPKESTKPLSEY